MDKQTRRFATLNLYLGRRAIGRQDHLSLTRGGVATAMLLLFSGAFLSAQTPRPDAPKIKLIGQQGQEAGNPSASSSQSDQGTAEKTQISGASPATASASQSKDGSKGKQPKRILWIIPNYRAVSADTQLPPLSPKGKFWLATQDSFDYSSFALSGILAGISQARNDTPEFRDEAYAKYLWHSFVDQAVGNYFTEALMPIATRQDPRYYTLGHGGFFRRSGYALSRLLITRTDSGGRNFNFSEIVGNGAGAGLSNLYYPRQERTLGKTGQKWALQVGIDGLFNMGKEFWPDIDRAIFHGHYGSRRVQ